ncbi:hypothetical protein PAPHI01_2296 [Pancytospora philotis]|nr:hypothetical protein PAPHI01_2296 [Pancytospora philotis]
MIPKILQILSKADTFKLFTTPTGPSIYEAFAQAKEPLSLPEIHQVIRRYFAMMTQGVDPSSFVATEAARMQGLADKALIEMQKEYIAQQALAPRDQNDELVALYLDSMNYFVAGLDIPVLTEHMKYLEE